MSKSPFVIGAIGIAGCLALSMVMREGLRVHSERRRHPLESELEARFGPRLVGPVRVVERAGEAGSSLVLELRVLAGLRKERFVEEAGRIAWERWRGSPTSLREVEVIVTDNGDAVPLAVTVPRPRFGRRP